MRSTFMQQLDGVGSKVAIYHNNNCKRYLITNRPLKAIYIEALEGSILPNHILPDIKDSQLFRDHNAPVFCYELIAPENTSIAQMHKWMKVDIERYFGITGKFEKRKRTCYALTISDSTKLFFCSDTSYLDWSDDNPIKHIVGKPLSALIDELNNSSSSTIFIDKTESTKLVNLELNISDADDIDELQKQLAINGLALIKEFKEVEMFVISDN